MSCELCGKYECDGVHRAFGTEPVEYRVNLRAVAERERELIVNYMRKNTGLTVSEMIHHIKLKRHHSKAGG